MRNLALAAVIAVSAMAAGGAARAMPGLQMSTPDSGIVQVAEGCGPRFHRTPFGRCVPNYYRGPVRRFCPPGTHLGRFGACRRNF
jgi:hypothetical protein